MHIEIFYFLFQISYSLPYDRWKCYTGGEGDH